MVWIPILGLQTLGNAVSSRYAALAQLVEQRIRNAQVEGSSPLGGSNFSPTTPSTSKASTPSGGGRLCCPTHRFE